MTTTLQATFDGKVFVPDKPVDLAPGQVVQLQVQSETAHGEKTPMQLLVEKWKNEPVETDAPTDLAAQHDHYLYGTPKRDNA